MPALEAYRDRWTGWVQDTNIETYGFTFDRTPAGLIMAPAGRVRVCAWHADFDERPTCYLDVDTVEEAEQICGALHAACSWSVDYASAHDADGGLVCRGPY
jgi:hypothetical protein